MEFPVFFSTGFLIKKDYRTLISINLLERNKQEIISIINQTQAPIGKDPVPDMTMMEEAEIEKQIIAWGDDNTEPTTGDVVKCHYVLKTPDGLYIDNTYHRLAPYSFIFGIDKTTKGFHEAISTMKLKESSTFLVPSQFLNETQGLPEKMAQHTNLTLNIHRLYIRQELHQDELINKEQLTKSQATMVKHPAPDIAVMTKTTAESMSSSKRSSNKTNILDDLEAEQDGDGNKKGEGTKSGEVKPPPYVPGAPNPQDPSRGPPPPYPGQQKVSRAFGMVFSRLVGVL